jgi:hypothetical protein
MAELARQGGTGTEVAKFEDWDPAGRTFNVVIAAQAWHWVDPAAGAAKAAAQWSCPARGRCGQRGPRSSTVGVDVGIGTNLPAVMHPRRGAERR